VVGQAPSGVPTASYFDDSNTAITFTDTEYSLSDFTQIIFDDAATEFSLDTVTFTAIGTNNPGILRINNAATTGSIASCNFNNIGNTFLNSNVTINGTNWIGCDLVYQSGSTLAGCGLVNTTAISSSLISDNPGLISTTDFTGDGTNHGIEITTAGSYTFAGNTFTGYGADETFSSSLYNNSGGQVTMSITANGDVATVRNGPGATTLVVANTAVTLTGMQENTEVRVFDTGTTNELAGVEDASDGDVNDRSFTFSLQAATVVDLVIHSLQYQSIRTIGYEVPGTDTELPISQVFDRNYLNPV